VAPEAYRDQIAVVTLHDGDHLPEHLLASPGVARLAESSSLTAEFNNMRDWGADLVAHHLASALGLSGHQHVNTARLLVDFNRFPGSTPPEAGHLDRRAIHGSLAEVLDHAQKRQVLADHYDAVSDAMDAVIEGTLILLSIHTYDEHNVTKTQRPEVSLLTRSDSYQQHSRLPYGLFDPMFPDILVESSAKHVLRDRLALTLEKSGVYVEHNYPYCLPDGSLEIRSQPWFFFHRLRDRFEDAYPATAEQPAFEMVWHMLLNTNLRDAESEALSAYLHRFSQPLRGLEIAFGAARRAYDAIHEYLDEQTELVDRYRRSVMRTSAITIEVRKDLVWRFVDGEPAGPNEDRAREIGELLAQGVTTYLKHDRAPVA